MQGNKVIDIDIYMAISLQYFISSGLWAWWAWSRDQGAVAPSSTGKAGDGSPDAVGGGGNNIYGVVARLSAWYASMCLFGIASLFVLRRGDSLLGKSPVTGQLPIWSYVAFWPFHLHNFVLVMSKKYLTRRHVPDANQVLPNIYIGGWFSDGLSEVPRWKAIVDLTTEFPERASSDHYLNVAVWDGNPPSPPDIDVAAKFIVKYAKQGPTLVHCAAGIGRSTTVLCAALVEGGFAQDYAEALAIIKSKRPIVRLNKKMKDALSAWQEWRIKQT